MAEARLAGRATILPGMEFPRVKQKPTTPAGWTAKQLRLAVDAAGVAMWSWNVDDDTFTMDRRGHELWDLPVRDRVSFEDLSTRIHPADKDRVRAAFSATRAILGPYETDFRIMHGSEVRWISARARATTRVSSAR